MVTVGDTPRFNKPFNNSSKSPSRMRRVDARRRQARRQVRDLFGRRLSRVRRSSRQGGVQDNGTQSSIPASFIFILLIESRNGSGREPGRILQVIRQRLRRHW